MSHARAEAGDYLLKEGPPANQYNGTPYLFLFQPDFEDDRCLDTLAGLYWNEDDYFMQTRLFTRVGEKGLTIQRISHNSMWNDFGGKNHWFEEFDQTLTIGVTQAEQDHAARRYTSKLVYCQGPNRLISARIEHRLHGENFKTTASLLGSASSYLVYNIWERVQGPQGEPRVRHDIGWEQMFHRSSSPYLDGKPQDDLRPDSTRKALIGRKIMPVQLTNREALSIPFEQLDFGLFSVEPMVTTPLNTIVEDEAYAELLEDAPLWVFGENLITEYGPQLLFPDHDCHTLRSKTPTENDIQARKNFIRATMQEKWGPLESHRIVSFESRYR